MSECEKNAGLVRCILAKVKKLIAGTIQEAPIDNTIYGRRNADWTPIVVNNGTYLGSIVPTSVPTGTGAAYWTAVQAGTYTNFGGVVVAANSFATISRGPTGTFSISQTPLDINTFNTTVSNTLLKNIDETLVYKGTATTATATPTATINDAYIATQTGTVFGQAVIIGDILVGNGSAFTVRKKLSPLKDRVITSKQLLDINDLVYQNILYTSDTVGSSTTLNSTNFIKVVPGRTYYFRHSAGFRHGIMRYASNLESSKLGRLSASVGTFGAYSFVMPADTNYIKVGLVAAGETRDPATFTQFSLSEGDYFPTDDMTYKGFYVNGTMQDLPFGVKKGSLAPVLETEPSSTNILNYDTILKGIGINTGLTALATLPGTSVSDFIKCKINTTYTFGILTDLFDRRVLYYDENFVPVSGAALPGSAFTNFEGDNATQRHLTFTVPNTPSIKYFRINIHASDATYPDKKSTYTIYEGNISKPYSVYTTTKLVDSNEINPKQALVEQYASNLSRRPVSFDDKTILILGDSITSNNVWVDYFAKNIRPKKVWRYAAGGCRIVNTNGVVNPSAYLNSGCDNAYKFVADFDLGLVTAPDYVLICLGTNELDRSPNTSVVNEIDVDNAFTLGGTTLTPIGSVDITKIPGAMRYMVQTLSAKFPSTKFMFWTPIPSTFSSWQSQLNVGNTIRWTAKRMSLPVIDLQANSNIITLFDYPASTPTYRNLVDGIHPFGTGVVETPATKMIGEQVTSEFLNYVLISK